MNKNRFKKVISGILAAAMILSSPIGILAEEEIPAADQMIAASESTVSTAADDGAQKDIVKTGSDIADYTADIESAETWEASLPETLIHTEKAKTGEEVTEEDYRADIVSVARSQIGYQESEKNFIYDENGVKRSYNRYAVWYGKDDYGDPWDAEFAEFVLWYAGIKEAGFDEAELNARIPAYEYNEKNELVVPFDPYDTELLKEIAGTEEETAAEQPAEADPEDGQQTAEQTEQQTEANQAQNEIRSGREPAQAAGIPYDADTVYWSWKLAKEGRYLTPEYEAKAGDIVFLKEEDGTFHAGVVTDRIKELQENTTDVWLDKIVVTAASVGADRDSVTEYKLETTDKKICAYGIVVDKEKEQTSEETGTAEEGSDTDEQAEKSDAEKSGTGTSGTEDGRTEDRQAKDGQAKDGQTEDGQTKDGQTKDGQTEDGQTKDGQTEDSRSKTSRAKTSQADETTIEDELSEETDIIFEEPESSEKEDPDRSESSEKSGAVKEGEDTSYLRNALEVRDGNWATWKIEVYQERPESGDEDTFVLSAAFSDNQSVDYASIKVEDTRNISEPGTAPDPAVTYDYSGETGTYVIPYDTPVTITYRTRIKAQPGETVEYSNTAEIEGTDTPVTDSHTDIIYPSASDAAGSEGVYMVKLYVYGSGNMQTGIPGAQFILLDENQRPMTYKKGENADQPVSFTTDENGYANVQLDEEPGDVSIQKNTAYYLEMIKSPDGFKRDTTLYNFMITDDPDYNSGGVWTYYNGDTLKVRLYEEEPGLTVSVRFSGNYSLRDDQKDNIRVILQKYEMNAWVDMEAHTFSEFSNGSLTFGIGTAENPFAADKTYRVVEENQRPWDLDVTVIPSSTYYLMIGSSDSEQGADPLEFTLTEDTINKSISLVIDNEYEEPKLTITKMDKETGETLSGAGFTVRKAVGDTDVVSYTTGDSGVLEISGGEAFESEILYYIVETDPPAGYLLPIEPQKIYFYFCNDEEMIPYIIADLPPGETAVNLSETYESVTLDNQKEKRNITVMKTWQGNNWPSDTVKSVVVGLYQSADNSDPVPVTDEQDQPLTVTLTAQAPYNNSAFTGLPARNGENKNITYSIKEEHVYSTSDADILTNYVQEYGVSDSGVYIVRNSPATTLAVSKEWYDQGGSIVTDGTILAQQSDVTFDIYRSASKISDEIAADGITNEELEALLDGMTKVREGLTFGSADGWTKSVNDLPKRNDLGNDYYYYVHETVPSFGDETYEADEAAGTVKIKNPVAPENVSVTVVKAELVDDPRPEAVNTDFNFTLTLSKGTHRIRNYKVADGVTTDWNGEAVFSLKPYDPNAAEQKNEITLSLPEGVTAAVTEELHPEYVEVGESENLIDLDPDEKRTFRFAVNEAADGRTITYTNTLRVICKVIDDNGTAWPFESLKSALAYVRNNPGSFTEETVTVYMLEDYVMPATDVFDVRADESITLTTASTEDAEFPFTTDRTEDTDTAIITRGGAGGSMLTNEGMLTLNNITLDGAKDGFTAAGDGGLISSSGTLNLNADTTLRNSAAGGRGGAVYSTGTVNMSAGSITGNSAASGSAIYLNDCTMNMTGGEISGNTVEDGGAVAVSSTQCRINLSGSPVIFGNSSTGGAWANIYLGVDSDNVIYVPAPGLGADAHIGVLAMETHREIGEQFATTAFDVTANLNCFVNDLYEYRGKVKEGTSTNVVWDGLTLNLKKVVASRGANPNDTFTVTLSSSSIRKSSYTIDGNLDYTITAAKINTPGSIVLRGVKNNDEISIYPLPVGTYTVAEAESNYTPSYEGHDEDEDSGFSVPGGEFSLQGNSTVTVTNTRRLADVRLTKTLEDTLKSADETQAFGFTVKLTDADGTAVSGFALKEGITTDAGGTAVFTMSPSNTQAEAQDFKAPVGAEMTITETDTHDYRITTTTAICDDTDPAANIVAFPVTDGSEHITFANVRKMAGIELRKNLVNKVSREESFTFNVTLTRKDGYPAADYTMYEDAEDPLKNITTDENGEAVITFSFGENESSKAVNLTIPDGTKLEVEETYANGHADWYNTTYSLNDGAAVSGNKATIAEVSDTDSSIVFTNSRKMVNVTVTNTVKGYSGNTRQFLYTAVVTDGDDYDENGFTDGVFNKNKDPEGFLLATGQSQVLTVPYGATLNITEEFVVGYETIITHGTTTLTDPNTDVFTVEENVTVAFTNNQLVGLAIENNTSSTFENVQVYIEKKTKVYRVTAAQDDQDLVTLTNKWASFDVAPGERLLLEIEHDNTENYIQKYIVKGSSPMNGYYYTITNEPSYHEYANPAIMRVYNVGSYEVSGQLRFGGTDSTVTFTEQPLVSFDVNGGAWTTEMEGYYDRDGSRQIYQYAVNTGETVPRPQPDPVYPTAEGIQFLGWTDDESVAQAPHTSGETIEEFDFDNTAITGAVTLYAVWSRPERSGRVVTVENTAAAELNVTATLSNTDPAEGVTLADGVITGTGGQASFTLQDGERINLTVPDGAKLVLAASGASCIEYSSVYTDADNTPQSFTINPVKRDGTVSFIAGICKITDSAGNVLYTNTGLPAVYGTLAAAFTAYNGTLYTDASRATPADQAAVKMLIDEYGISSVHGFPTKNATVTTAGKDDTDFPYVGIRDRATLYRTAGFTGDSLFTLQSTARTVTLTDIILDGGNVGVVKSKNGGLINVNQSGAVLNITTGTTLRNVVFAAYDDGNNARGGAIYINNGTLNIDAGLFSNLKARRGGAINAESNATLNITGVNGSTRFEDCTTESNNNNNAGGDGGAIYYASSTQALTIDGGTEIDEDSEIIPGIIFNRCKALTKFGDGGAICADTSYYNNVTIIGCEFTECSSEVTSNHDGITNTSGNGGGAIAAYHVKGLKAQNCDFNSCDTMLCGGAIVAMVKTVTGTIPDDEGTIYIDNCDFDTCNCKAQGGAVAVYQDNNGATGSTTKLLIESSSFTNCSSGTDNGSGGAIQSYVPCMTFIETTFIDCWAGKEGGAVNNWYGGNDSQMWTNASVIVDNCNFIRCRAEDRYQLTNRVHFGGGIATKARTLSVNDSYFEDCVSTLREGGAIHCSGVGSGSSATISNSTFKGCMAKDNGGAVTANNETLTVSASYFYGCSSFAENGGAIYHGKSVNDMTQLTTTITNCTFSGFTDADITYPGCSAAKDGGAIWTKASTATIEDCSLTKCTAGINGGAIRTESATVNVNNCTISECEASGNGGGMYFGKEYASTTISGGSITGGHAVNGSAVYVYNRVSATFSDTTVTGNVVSNIDSAAVHGGGNGSILFFEGDVKVEDNTCSADAVYDHDVLMQRNDNNDANMTIVQTTSSGLGAQAHVGIYVPDAVFDRRGTEGKVFGTFGSGQGNNNLDSFFNDRNDRLFGYQASSDNSYIYWGKIICKITDADGNTLLRAYNKKYAVYQKLSMAFSDFPNDFTYDEEHNFNEATPACIKMIIESYDLPDTATISVPASETITLTTAGKEEVDGLYEYEGEDNCIINRGKSTSSLFTVQNRASFTLTDITLDGGAVFTDEGVHSGGSQPNVDGGLIATTAAAAIHINSGATLQNTAINNGKGGAAVFLNNDSSSFNMDGGVIRNCLSGSRGGAAVSSHGAGSVTVLSGRFENCNTLSGWGGAIFCKANQVKIGSGDKDYTEFINCKTKGACGGAISHQHATANNSANVEITHVRFVNCTQEQDNNGNGGGALYTNAKTISVTDSIFTDCRAKNNGGAISARDNGTAESLMTISGCTFTNCESEKRSGGAIYSAVKTLTVQNNAGRRTVMNSCRSLNEGGAIRFEKASGTVNLTNVDFIDCNSSNTNQNGLGGGLYTSQIVTVNVTDSTFESCKAGVKSGAIHMNTSGSVLNIKENTVISRCYANQGGAIYLNSGVTLNLTGSPEFTRNGYTTAGQNAAAGACIYLAEGSSINLSGSPKFSRNNITNVPRVTNGGVTDYVRQDLYLAGYSGRTATSINVAGELAGDTIWVWPEQSPHKVSGEQFAVTVSSVSSSSLEKFRNALADEVTGCSNGEYLAGVRLGSDTGNVYWSKMYNISFRKIDNKAVTVAEAEFTLFSDSGCTAAVASAVSADGENDTGAQGEILARGVVDFENIPIGAYYMKETREPVSFKENDTVYLVLVGSPYLSENEYNRDLWENGGPLDQPNAATLVARSTTGSGRYYGIFPLKSDGKADLTRNLASANAGVTNIRNDFTAYFMKLDGNGLPLPNAEFTVYTQVTESGQPASYDNGYPKLTLWSRDQETYPEPARSADGTSRYKDLEGKTLPKGVVYFRELPIGTYYLLESYYPDRNGSNRRTFFVESDRVFRLEIVDEEDFTLSIWNEDGTYSEITERKVENGVSYYAVGNTEAVCKITDDNNKLLYVLGHDGETRIPAIYPTLEEGFAAAQTGSFVNSEGNTVADDTLDPALKLKALKDFTMTAAVAYDSPRALTFTTAERTAGRDDRYTFITTRTYDTSRAEIKRGYSETEVNSNGGALITVKGGSALTLQNIDLNGQKQTFNGRAVYVENGGSLTMLNNTLLQRFSHRTTDDGTEGVSVKDVKGGAVYLESGASLSVNGGGSRTAEFSNNEAVNNRTAGESTGADGGAVAGEYGSLISVQNARFTGNSASSAASQKGNGGAVALSDAGNEDEPSALTFTNTVFNQNTASYRGGAILAGEKRNVTLSNVTISGNRAADGGAIAIAPAAAVILENGSIQSNTASGNGGAVYVGGSENKEGHFIVQRNGSLSGNRAGAYGGAVYVNDYAAATISGSITGNSAGAADGGAINTGSGETGLEAKLYFTGSPVVFNNPGGQTGAQQKNVVLSRDSNGVINTAADGLDGGVIGVYVINGGDNRPLYNAHGVMDKPFGTFGDAGRMNPQVFMNDRNLSLGGRIYKSEEEDENTIYWTGAVCKLTDMSDKLLYREITVRVGNRNEKLKAPAIYGTVQEGFDAAQGALYNSSGSPYNTKDVKLKLLQDIELDAGVNYAGACRVTFTTAETAVIPAMSGAGDEFIFVTARTDEENNAATEALVIRAFNESSMITASGAALTLAAITLDGNRNSDQNYTVTANGGIVNVANGSRLIVGTKAVLENSATSGSGGAVYVNRGAGMTITSGSVNGNAASSGAGIYLAEGSALNISGDPYFGGAGVEENRLVTEYTDEEEEKTPAGNFVIQPAFTEEYVNGGLNYPADGENRYYSRQDIFIAGYTGTEETPNPAASLVIAGNITSGDGTIWVWAEGTTHIRTEEQFAMLGNGVTVTEATLKAFRNAQDDVTTENNTGDYLYGATGEQTGYIYWSGLKGSRKVILRKTDEGYVPLQDAQFTVTKVKSSDAPPVSVKHEDGTTEELKELASGPNGIIWIGILPYGTYYLHETAYPAGTPLDKWFVLSVTEEGADCGKIE